MDPRDRKLENASFLMVSGNSFLDWVSHLTEMSPCRDSVTIKPQNYACYQTAWPALMHRCPGVKLKGKTDADLPTCTAVNCCGKFHGV